MYLITLLSLIGVVANIYKKRWCFYIWAFTNFTWAVYDWRSDCPLTQEEYEKRITPERQGDEN